MKIVTRKSCSRHFLKTGVFLLCLVLTLACPCHAGPRPLKVAVFHVRPYGFMGENGQIQGLNVDQAKAVMTEAGLPYNIILANFARILSELRRGNVDMTILLFSDAALEVAECLETIIELKNIVVGKKGTRWSSLKDLHGLKLPIGTSRGAKYGKPFDEDPLILKYPINRYEQGLKMMFNGRLAGIVGVEDGIFNAARALGYSREAFGTPLLIQEVWGCIYFSRTTAPGRSAERRKIIDAARRLKADQVFRRIDQKWIQ